MYKYFLQHKHFEATASSQPAMLGQTLAQCPATLFAIGLVCVEKGKKRERELEEKEE